MHQILESFPNRKIVLTNADDKQFDEFNLKAVPYGIFTMKHKPDKTDPKYFRTMLKHFGLEPVSIGTKPRVVYQFHS